MPFITPHKRPRILLLIDEWDWAFHTIARAIERYLGDEYTFTILCVADKPVIDDMQFDIIHVLFETETYHRNFLRGRSKIVKSVYSHYWQLEGKSASAFYQEHLWEAHAVVVPSMRLFQALETIPCPLYICPEGVDTQLFQPREDRAGTMSVAWAGMDRPVKRLNMLREACDGLIQLRTALNRQYREAEMPAFYAESAVVACTSIAEGCPRPLLEGMACGAFPVTTDVGVVPELIRHKENGYVVNDANVDTVRTALQWCMDNTDILKRARRENRTLIEATRQWNSTIRPLGDVYHSLLRT